jgi:acyl-CoA synthetase (AMP-forming)/AMP-acid ligase II
VNLAALGEENVRRYGEYVSLVPLVDTLPKSPIGRILRKELRALAS